MEMSRTPEPDKLVSFFIERKRASDYIPFLEWKLMGQGNYSNRFSKRKPDRQLGKLGRHKLIWCLSSDTKQNTEILGNILEVVAFFPNFFGEREGGEKSK